MKGQLLLKMFEEPKNETFRANRGLPRSFDSDQMIMN